MHIDNMNSGVGHQYYKHTSSGVDFSKISSVVGGGTGNFVCKKGQTRKVGMDPWDGLGPGPGLDLI